MKAVLISIRPEWCRLIAHGKKTVEIRKTVPRDFFREYAKESNGKCGDYFEPFKVYIYCTEPNTVDPHKYLETHYDGHIYKCNGKVFAEFVCNKITELAPINKADDTVEEKSCMSREEIVRYLKGKGYAWDISDLVIYDKPKGLGAFRVQCKEYDKDRPRCGNCEYYYYESNESVSFYDECGCDGLKHITRPPQSWCYVEVV